MITGWADGDDLPEAIEDPTRRFALGVQWHPEADVRSVLVGALVSAAEHRRTAADETEPVSGDPLAGP